MGRLSRSIKSVRLSWGRWMTPRNQRVSKTYEDPGFFQATRDVTGMTGWVMSSTWDQLAENHKAYIKSFDRDRLPPSLHISERDRIRMGLVMPKAERCMSDQAALLQASSRRSPSFPESVQPDADPEPTEQP